MANFLIKIEIFYQTLYSYLILYLAESRLEIGPFHFAGTLKTGKGTSVMCAVTDGDPPFKFTWLKDGKDVVEGSTYSIRNVDDFTSNLAIKQLGPEHNRNYTCRVSNAYGTVQHSDMLLMQCKQLTLFFYKN